MYRFNLLLPHLRAFVHCRSGATAIEYSLIAGLIGIAIITGARLVGTNLNSKFTAIAAKVGTGTGVTP